MDPPTAIRSQQQGGPNAELVSQLPIWLYPLHFKIPWPCACLSDDAVTMEGAYWERSVQYEHSEIIAGHQQIHVPIRQFKCGGPMEF